MWYLVNGVWTPHLETIFLKYVAGSTSSAFIAATSGAICYPPGPGPVEGMPTPGKGGPYPGMGGGSRGSSGSGSAGGGGKY